MSAFGTKRTSRHAQPVSAFGGKADTRVPDYSCLMPADLMTLARDWNDVADEIVVEIVVKRGVDRVRCIDLQERITVGRRANHNFSANSSAGARSVLYYERLAEALYVVGHGRALHL